MSLDSALPPSPIRWALAGYGNGGRIFHAPLIDSEPSLQLSAVVTANPDRIALLAAERPTATAVPDLDALPDLGIVGVTISTSTASHAPLAHRALDLGLHVVVDKPFALDAGTAAELCDHARAAGRLITCYQNRRWDSDFRTVRQLMADDRLGRVHTFSSRIERFSPVKPGWSHTAGAADGGGVLLDLGPHLVDQALVLFGPVDSVFAVLRTLRPGSGAEDDFVLVLRHRSGVTSTLFAGRNSAGQGPRFQVNGTDGGFVIGGFDIQEAQLKSGATPASLGSAWGTEPESAYGVLTTGAESVVMPSRQGDWPQFYRQVADAVRGDGPMPVDPQDAVRTAAVLDAARWSDRTGRAIDPAALPTGEDG